MRPKVTTCLFSLALWALVCAPPRASGQAPSGVLPAAVPLFPLPDVTLFPNSTQPFHVFEPRYRAMVADALAGDSIIGMVQLRPGYESDYEGRPPVYDIGCAGVIVSARELPDGRYDIVLRGVAKFRILDEDYSRAYRLARVEALPEAVPPDSREELSARRRQLENAYRSARPRARIPAGLTDEELVDGLSLVTPMRAAERQQLLEADGPLARAALLLTILRGGASSTL